MISDSIRVFWKYNISIAIVLFGVYLMSVWGLLRYDKQVCLSYSNYITYYCLTITNKYHFLYIILEKTPQNA